MWLPSPYTNFVNDGHAEFDEHVPPAARLAYLQVNAFSAKEILYPLTYGWYLRHNGALQPIQRPLLPNSPNTSRLF